MAVLMKSLEKTEHGPPSEDAASKAGLLVYKSATGSLGARLLPKPCGFGSLLESTHHLSSLSFSFFFNKKRRLDQGAPQH